MSQRECANICGSDWSIERRLYRWWQQQRKLHVPDWYRQLELPVQFNISYKMQLCPRELANAIYCIAWSFFSKGSYMYLIDTGSWSYRYSSI